MSEIGKPVRETERPEPLKVPAPAPSPEKDPQWASQLLAPYWRSSLSR